MQVHTSLDECTPLAMLLCVLCCSYCDIVVLTTLITGDCDEVCNRSQSSKLSWVSRSLASIMNMILNHNVMLVLMVNIHSYNTVSIHNMYNIHITG